jgi:glutathione S-transferase
MIKVYGGPLTRAGIVYIYLRELDLPFQAIPVNRAIGEQHSTWFRAINPIGQVPAIEDGPTKVWESGAIILYLAEKYGSAPRDIEERAALLCWILYANATLTPAVFSETDRVNQAMRVVAPLEHVLQSREFLLGAEFTAADVAVGGIVCFSALAFHIDYGRLPGVKNYVRRLLQRPSFQSVLGVP